MSATPADTDAANTGLSAASPKASIEALLASYDLETRNGVRNVIHVAAGTYNLTYTITLTPRAAGVEILGSGGRAVQNRGTTLFPVMTLNGAGGVSVESLGLTNGSTGIGLTSIPNFTLTSSQVSSNGPGVSIDALSVGWSIQGDVFQNNSGYGVSAAVHGHGLAADRRPDEHARPVHQQRRRDLRLRRELGRHRRDLHGQPDALAISAYGTGITVQQNIIAGGSTGISAGGGAWSSSATSSSASASTGISAAMRGSTLIGGRVPRGRQPAQRQFHRHQRPAAWARWWSTTRWD